MQIFSNLMFASVRRWLVAIKHGIHLYCNVRRDGKYNAHSVARRVLSTYIEYLNEYPHPYKIFMNAARPYASVEIVK